MTSVPRAVSERFEREECVLFLGPDISGSANGYVGLPSAWHLADALAEACEYRGRYMPLPRIALLYRTRFSEGELVTFIQEQLTANMPRPLPVHTILARLPARVIVYSGWDTLLEQALDDIGRPYQVIYSSSQDSLVSAHERDLLIYKPFGTLEPADSMVIAEDQQQVLFQSSSVIEAIGYHLRRTPLLVVSFAPDYDTIFVRLLQKIRAEGLAPPAYVVQSVQQAQAADYLASWGIRPIFADPARFLYQLAEEVSDRRALPAPLPAWDELSRAQRARPEDVVAQVDVINRTLDTLGIGMLLEKSDVPLLNAEQVRELETMRDAYERLTVELGDLDVSAAMWLRQGNIEYSRQNYEKAEDYYERVLAIDEASPEAIHNLHYVYLAQARLLRNANCYDEADVKLDEALALYNRAVALRPDLAILPPTYEPDRILGLGGIGIVYRVVDRQNKRRYAVKVLDQAHMYNEQYKIRFQREALLLQRLDHPGIVKVIAWDTYEGRLFIVMEYLGEMTLAGRLREEGALSLDEANQITQEIASALSAAHEKGVIHRDVKPSNVFLVDGSARLIDFGLAVELDHTQASMIGLATGSIRYMAPEQRMGLDLDRRTDVYALATLFYKMVTGVHPDEGTYSPISEMRKDATPILDIVVDKARAFSLDARPPTVQAFAHTLQQAIAAQPGSASSPAWQRAIARYQAWLSRVSFDYWWLAILLAFLVGLGIPPLFQNDLVTRSARAAGMLIWSTVFLNLILTGYTTLRIRQTGYVGLATFGGLMSTLLALVGTLVVAASITPQASGRLSTGEFVLDVIFISFGLFFAGVLSSGAIHLTTRLLQSRYPGTIRMAPLLLVNFLGVLTIMVLVSVFMFVIAGLAYSP